MKKARIYICECSDTSHNIVIDHDDESIFISVILNNHSVLKRIILAVKYVFGIDCKYNHYQEVILDKDTAHALRNTLSEMIEEIEKTDNDN